MTGGFVAPRFAGSRRKRPGRVMSMLGKRPGVIVASGFGATIMLGSVALMLPVASASGDGTSFVIAVFTATSAVCITGLTVVDTSTHWSTVGEIIILGLIQIGGLGIMSLASILGVLVFRHLGLQMRLTTQAERTGTLGDVRQLVFAVLRISVLWELATAVFLSARLTWGYDIPGPRAIYMGVFHSVASFNNAGFSLFPNSLAGFVADPWFCLPIVIASIAGGLGFPVLIELARRARKPRGWSLHTKITVVVSAGLVLVGTCGILIMEWANPHTLGQLNVAGKLIAGVFQGVTPRSSGFSTVDVAEMRPETHLFMNILMLIGGGSASTAGGIKVTTFALLGFIMLAELRGEPSVHVMGKRLPVDAQRQALTVTLLAIGAVVVASLVILALTRFSMEQVLFEAISGFATVGLSMGITAELPGSAKLVLALLMFIGRIGPMVLASALALRVRTRRYELPEARPMVG